MKKLLTGVVSFVTAIIICSYFVFLSHALETQDTNKAWPVITFGLGALVMGSLFTAHISLNKIKS